jgi:hypothetical protein
MGWVRRLFFRVCCRCLFIYIILRHGAHVLPLNLVLLSGSMRNPRQRHLVARLLHKVRRVAIFLELWDLLLGLADRCCVLTSPVGIIYSASWTNLDPWGTATVKAPYNTPR